jgi:hypothetical protein
MEERRSGERPPALARTATGSPALPTPRRPRSDGDKGGACTVAFGKKGTYGTIVQQGGRIWRPALERARARAVFVDGAGWRRLCPIQGFTGGAPQPHDQNARTDRRHNVRHA